MIDIIENIIEGNFNFSFIIFPDLYNCLVKIKNFNKKWDYVEKKWFKWTYLLNEFNGINWSKNTVISIYVFLFNTRI